MSARWLLPVLGSVVAAAIAPGPSAAQEDFRNADLGRPLLTEDAHPVKFREWEWEVGTRGRLLEGGTGSGATGVVELKTGLFLNAQVGLELEAAAEDTGAGHESGLEGFGAHVLYNVSRETWSWPAFAARLDLEGPGTGDEWREDWGVGFRGVATRSIGRLRLHANGGYHATTPEDGGDHWLAGLAFDVPVGLFSRLVMGDVYAEVPVDTGRTRVWVEAGTRWQITNVSVVDLGLATRLDEWERGRANVELVVGLSRVFGLRAWTTVPAYPDPRID